MRATPSKAGPKIDLEELEVILLYFTSILVVLYILEKKRSFVLKCNCNVVFGGSDIKTKRRLVQLPEIDKLQVCV